jgi:UPF0755 protein
VITGFQGALNSLDLARGLEDPTPGDVRFIVLAGWRLEEIAAALPTSGLPISPQEFLAKAHHPARNGCRKAGVMWKAWKGCWPRVNMSFRVRQPQINEQHDDRAVGNADQYQKSGDGFASQGLSLKEGVTLASIVQKEAVVEDEQARIASVFLNRWIAGMKLDSDPTVQYAVGNTRMANTWWVNPFWLRICKLNSPYNTYIYSSLPPTPICAVSDKALRAVAFPENNAVLLFSGRL